MEPTRTVSIIGTGSYVPEKVLTNQDLEKIVDTSDEWIFSRTGMRERHIAAPDQATSDLGTEAAKAALADAGISAEEIDLLIVATLSPDMLFPSTACFVQERIGAKNAFCYDLGAACSGFLYALDTAKNQIAGGAAKTALVIGAEKMSTFLDWEDRGTCILFGDGAGAAVLQAGGEGRGIMKAAMGCDGSLADLLWTPGGGSRNPATHEMIDQRQQYLKMQGRQANTRIIDSIAKRLGIADRMYTNVEKYANTSSAALAIALDEAVKDGTIKRGDLVALTVFGGGFTWGANVLEWNK